MKNIFRLMATALLAASMFSACTGAFEDLNTNPKGVSDEELKQDNNYIGMHFIPMMQSIYYNKGAGTNVWEYQLIQNLNADLWSGYLSTATAFAGNVSNVTYSMNAGWNDNCWSYAYNNVMVESLKITKKCLADMEVYAHFEAINTICRVVAMSRLVDQYGCIIYTHYGESAVGGKYDSGKEAYTKFFEELAEAADVLRAAREKRWLRSLHLTTLMAATWTNGLSCAIPSACAWPCVSLILMLPGQRKRLKRLWQTATD